MLNWLQGDHCSISYWWLSLCKSIQNAADTGDVKKIYEGIKKATGPPTLKVALLNQIKTGETFSDPSQQLDCWVEHYLKLYATQNKVSMSALDSIPAMTIMEAFDVLPTNFRRTQQGNKCFGNRKSSRGWWHPIRELKTEKPVLTYATSVRIS